MLTSLTSQDKIDGQTFTPGKFPLLIAEHHGLSIIKQNQRITVNVTINRFIRKYDVSCSIIVAQILD